MSTLAGAGEPGDADGPAATARFRNPTGIARAGDGTLFVTEYDANRVRRIAPDGAVSTLTAPATFRGPYAVVVAGDVVVVQTDNAPDGSRSDASGTLWRLEADGLRPLVEGLGRPRGLGALPDGRIVVADRMRNTISLLEPGTKAMSPLAGVAGNPGNREGKGDAASFDSPHGITAYEGGVLVADTGNHRIRRVALDGTVTAFAGDGVDDTRDGTKEEARFMAPRDLAADSAGNVYVADTGGRCVRRIGSDGMVRTLAGDGSAGYRDGAGPQARFHGLESLDVAPDGKAVFVTDGTGGNAAAPSHLIRRITLP